MNGKTVVSILTTILLGTSLVIIGCGVFDDNSQPVIKMIPDKTLEIGDKRRAKVYITDTDIDDIHTINAFSDNTNIAAVSVDDASFTITGKAVGIATITVSATDDSGQDNATSVPVTFQVTVKEPIPRVGLEFGIGRNQPPSSFVDKGVCSVGMISKPGEGCSYDSNELLAKINFFVRQDGTVCREQVPDFGGLPIPEDLLPRKLKFCVEWDIEQDDFFETRFAASKNPDGSWTVKRVP